MMPKNETSWGSVAPWYDDLLESGSTFQKEVILPDVLEVLSLRGGERVLDLACGQGFFTRAFKTAGAQSIGVDISSELIGIARNYKDGIEYHVSPAHKLDFLSDSSVDKVTIILAIQNIAEVSDVFRECHRVLKPQGSLVVVLNHPAFRIPRGSSWGFDGGGGVQYRRVDRYMSEFKVAIKMHPGEKDSAFTSSFHRPLGFYFKSLQACGFMVKTLHELTSNKKSQPGPRAQAEDTARREIPLFMTFEALRGL